MADLIPFAYHNHAVWTMQHDDGSTWWVAADVCAALALPNVSRACARLKDHEKDELTLSDVTGRPQVMLIVSYPTLKLLGFLLPGFRPWASSRPKPEERSSLGTLTGPFKVGLPPRSHPLRRLYLVFCTLCEEEKAVACGNVLSLPSLKGMGFPHGTVSEPGLYRLIMRSRKKEAEDFQQWVYAEVLPHIRKTGSYGQPTTPAVLNPEHQLMIDMIVQLDRTEQRAKAAEATAARAEGKADMALADARTMTLEEFVLSNGLLRQMPEAHWPSYVTWLKDVCLARGHDFSKGQVLGKRWQMENVYPLQALCALKHHVQTKPTQLALVRQREQEGHA